MNNPYIKNLKTTIFDIETGGLSPASSGIICASFCDPATGEVEQLFCDNPLLEVNLIRDILDRLSEFDAVVTYNGDAFDMNFVLQRAKKYDLCSRLPFFWSVDLYRWLKKYWPAAKTMAHLNQKSVEFALGFAEDRTDPIGGAECISLYAKFLSLGDTEAKDAILLHNGDDVRQLAKIYNAVNFLPWHEIGSKEGFLFKGSVFPYLLYSNQLVKNGDSYSLKASGRTAVGQLPASIFADSFKLEYDSKTGKIDLCVYLEKKSRYVFLDLEKLQISDERMLSMVALPETKDGFLVLQEDDVLHYRAMNILAQTIISSL